MRSLRSLLCRAFALLLILSCEGTAAPIITAFTNVAGSFVAVNSPAPPGVNVLFVVGGISTASAVNIALGTNLSSPAGAWFATVTGLAGERVLISNGELQNSVGSGAATIFTTLFDGFFFQESPFSPPAPVGSSMSYPDFTWVLPSSGSYTLGFYVSGATNPIGFYTATVTGLDAAAPEINAAAATLPLALLALGLCLVSDRRRQATS